LEESNDGPFTTLHTFDGYLKTSVHLPACLRVVPARNKSPLVGKEEKGSKRLGVNHFEVVISGTVHARVSSRSPESQPVSSEAQFGHRPLPPSLISLLLSRSIALPLFALPSMPTSVPDKPAYLQSQAVAVAPRGGRRTGFAPPPAGESDISFSVGSRVS
jgi:hypothetical protein